MRAVSPTGHRETRAIALSSYFVWDKEPELAAGTLVEFLSRRCG